MNACNPSELKIMDASESRRSASYLELFFDIHTVGRLHTRIYEERDDFNYPIVNFPFLSSKTSPAILYGIYTFQLTMFALYRLL